MTAREVDVEEKTMSLYICSHDFELPAVGTISFGQSLDPLVLERAGAAAQGADLVISLGSTLSVHPAASFPLLAATRGIPYVIINRGATDQDGQPCVSLRLEGEVTAIFPVAVDAALA